MNQAEQVAVNLLRNEDLRMINDAVIVAIYAILAILIITTTVISLVQNVIRDMVKAYVTLSFCAIAWLVSVIAFYLITDPVIATYVDNIPFVFIAFCPVALFFFASRFYNSDDQVPVKYILLMCIIPFMTSCVALIPQLQWMLRTNYQIVSTSPIHVTMYQWNFWFFVHLIYSYILMLTSTILVIKQHIKQTIDHSLPSWLMVFGIIVTIVFNVLTVASPLPTGDLTLIGSSISIVIFYFAIIKNPSVEYISLARNALFSHIDLPVFILDKNGRVIELNFAATSFLDRLYYTYSDPFFFKDFMRAIEELGGVVEEGGGTKTDINVFFPQNKKSFAFSLTQREVVNKKKQVMGNYIVIFDISQLSEKIDNHKYKARVDPLTCIANRRAFDEQSESLDAEECLPLSIIIGDVNRLKYVNDNMGHHEGDQLLKLIAKILTDYCPVNGITARIGGDEFIIVVPRFSEDKAQKLMKDIDAKIRKEAIGYKQASIALGMTTRTSMDQDIRELINLADKKMYQNKYYDRRISVGRDGTTDEVQADS